LELELVIVLDGLDLALAAYPKYIAAAVPNHFSS